MAYFSRANENYSVGMIEVGTVTPYPAGYDECCDVAKQELNDKARPIITGSVDMEQYDIVFLGYPIYAT